MLLHSNELSFYKIFRTASAEQLKFKLFQMVDRLDDGFISADLGTLDYKGLYKVVFIEPKFH